MFLILEQLSQDPLYQFYHFYQLVRICVNVNDPDLFYRFMATNFMAKFGNMRSFGKVAFENGL